ncbi:MAG: hypothetical protein NUV82_02175 [Candidatus Komeilibacteria bacterium]|nr:hypothetical protein [Candidatus Komeilibacteria bacterium]
MKTDLVVAGYIFHQNKVLLVHHTKLGLWLPVGGHIDANETPVKLCDARLVKKLG